MTRPSEGKSDPQAASSWSDGTAASADTGQSPQGDSQSSVEAILDALTSGENYLGAALIGRDGVPVVVRFRLQCNEEAVSAMGAAIIGAADAALNDMSGEEIQRFAVESAGHRYQGHCLDEDLAVVLVTKTGVPIEDAFLRLQEAGRTLRETIGEA